MAILADTSAWIEFLRRTGSGVHERFRDAFESDGLLTTEVIVMEVLSGAQGRRDELRLKRMLETTQLVPVGSLATWETAAAINRACRAAGLVVRSQLDCLIAAVAIREDVEVLHADRDYDVIAQHTPLRVAAV